MKTILPQQEDFLLKKEKFVVAKIVSNPSSFSWSQAYNAGSLFAVLSLQREREDEEKEEESLSALGKKIIDTLEQNFFTIENKNLANIKQAVSDSSQLIPETIENSFVVCSFVKNVLYLFANNKGKVFIKRGEAFGTVLEANDPNEKALVAASGYVKNNDLIILGTKNFFSIVDQKTLALSLDHKTPAEIAEILTPTLHEKEENKAAAVIIQYEELPEANFAYANEEDRQEEALPDTPPQNTSFMNFLIFLKQKLKLPRLRINHSRKIFLVIAVIAFLVFAVSIFMAAAKQNEKKTKALFDNIYPQAQKAYEEGLSLSDLNKNLARDDFSEASKILNSGKGKFAKNSREAKQILELLAKVNKELEVSSPEKIVASRERSKIGLAVENGSGLEGVAGKAADFLKGKGYSVISTTNADSYNYQGVTIKTKSSTSFYLSLLNKDLSEKYTVASTSSDLEANTTADALIIIGK